MAGVDLGIDRLLLSDPTAFEIRPEYSGRMAASTALAFVLVGAAFLTLLYARAEEAARGIVGTVGLTLLALSVVTLLSYSTGVLSDLRFGAVTGVAIRSAVAFLGIGASLVACAWEQNRPALLPAWVPLAAGVATLCTTLVLTRAVTSQEEMRGRRQVQAIARHGQRRDLRPNCSRRFKLVARVAAFSADQDPDDSGGMGRRRCCRVMEDNPGIKRIVWLDSAWDQRAAVGIDAAPVDSATLMRVLGRRGGPRCCRRTGTGRHRGGRRAAGLAPCCWPARRPATTTGAVASCSSFVDGARLVRRGADAVPQEYGVRVRGLARDLYRTDTPHDRRGVVRHRYRARRRPALDGERLADAARCRASIAPTCARSSPSSASSSPSS